METPDTTGDLDIGEPGGDFGDMSFDTGEEKTEPSMDFGDFGSDAAEIDTTPPDFVMPDESPAESSIPEKHRLKLRLRIIFRWTMTKLLVYVRA